MSSETDSTDLAKTSDGNASGSENDLDKGLEKSVAQHAGKDAEQPMYEPIPYPKSVFFIVTNEFCERFSYYGLRTILVIYLSSQLHYDNDTSTVIYHVFICLCYFAPVLGAIIADSWLGKFYTIFYLSIVYAIGNIVVSLAAVPNLLPGIPFTMLGLALIALGTGGIKPCVSAFGGDQFVVPNQEKQLQKFFSLFYFAINAGSFISTFITPILREDVKCFEEDSCYSLAFGVPAALMVVSLAVFLLGAKFYKKKKPEGNVLVEVAKVMWHAGTTKSSRKRDHWLDKADDKYSHELIHDIKAVLRVLLLYIPLPIFWALFDQQGSRWTFQAARMTGAIGDFQLKPDQMQVVNPVLILVFIPLFEVVLYPLLARCNLLKRPLQRLTVGGTIAAISFIISAVVETQLEPTYPVLPVSGEAQLRFYNGLECQIDFKIQEDSVTLKPYEHWENLTLPCTGSKELDFTLSGDCLTAPLSNKMKIYEEEATSYTILSDQTILQVRQENTDKSDSGDPMVMIIYSEQSQYTGNKKIGFFHEDGNEEKTFIINTTFPYVNFTKIAPAVYTIKVDSKEVVRDALLEQGGSYTWVLNEKGGNFTQVTNPNVVHMLWLIPQYVVLTAGEVMFSITGLEFSFTQAPVSMKSVVTSAWLLTVAIGNVIVIIITEAKFFSSQTYEFLLFAGLMLVDMLIFALMAMRYTYVEDLPRDEKEETNANNIKLSEKGVEQG